MEWLSDAGTVYRLNYLDDLLQSNWIPLGVVTATSSETYLTDTNPVAGQRFYRISAE